MDRLPQTQEGSGRSGMWAVQAASVQTRLHAESGVRIAGAAGWVHAPPMAIVQTECAILGIG